MFDIKKWLGLSYYTSETDQFLNKLRGKKKVISASQQAEKSKYERINLHRDTEIKTADSDSFWDKF